MLAHFGHNQEVTYTYNYIIIEVTCTYNYILDYIATRKANDIWIASHMLFHAGRFLL